MKSLVPNKCLGLGFFCHDYAYRMLAHLLVIQCSAHQLMEKPELSMSLFSPSHLIGVTTSEYGSLKTFLLGQMLDGATTFERLPMLFPRLFYYH